MLIPNFADLGAPIAVVLHDAGAANIVINWLVRAGTQLRIQACVAGPAEALWQKALPDWLPMPLVDALEGATALVSGTGWSSTLEYESIGRARAIGIPAYAALDHWINYRERFVRHGIEILPNEVWVTDIHAEKAAHDQLPMVPMRRFDNVYLMDQVEAVRVLDRQRSDSYTTRILYALEPIRIKWADTDERPGEFQALDFFLSKLSQLGLTKTPEIRLRPHPSDPLDKYASWIASASHQGVNVSLAPDEPIANAVSWADVVVGCESFVLIIGLECGRDVVSTLPPWGHAIRLPHPGIRLMSHI